MSHAATAIAMYATILLMLSWCCSSEWKGLHGLFVAARFLAGVFLAALFFLGVGLLRRLAGVFFLAGDFFLALFLGVFFFAACQTHEQSHRTPSTI